MFYRHQFHKISLRSVVLFRKSFNRLVISDMYLVRKMRHKLTKLPRNTGILYVIISLKFDYEGRTFISWQGKAGKSFELIKIWKTDGDKLTANCFGFVLRK